MVWTRLRSTFVLALGLHAGMGLALRALVPPLSRQVPVARPSPPDELIVVTEEAPIAPPTPAPTSGTEAPEPAPLHPRVEPRSTARVNVGAPSPAPTVDFALAPPADPSARPAAPAVPVELGVGEYWKQVAIAPGASAATAEPPPAAPPAPGRILRDALEASDHARGLGPSGPLVSAAHEAASLPVAPDVGAAIFEVEADGDGKVIAAHVVASAHADVGAWSDVARELVSLMASKRIHVPRGAHGYRAVLRITAERTLPAGEKRTVSPGAVPEGACIGEGISRKCPDVGLPLGVGGTWGDLSNFGQKRMHVVHAQVLDEKTF